MRTIPEPSNDRRPTAPFELPAGVALADVSVDLLLYCTRVAEGINAARIMQARGGVTMAGIISVLQREADRAAALFWLIRDLEPHEEEFRQFLSSIAERQAPELQKAVA